MPVFAQEAYYWCYAQHLDLSYFDHPPMVAWLIWFGTQVFGDGVLGLRCGTLLCGLGVTLSGLALLRQFGASPKARIAWIILAVAVPYYAVIHFLATPDAPLALFWALSVLALWRARDGDIRWWIAAGLTSGLALSSKYSAGFLGVGGCVVFVCDSRLRAQVFRPGPWLAVAFVGLAFLPVVVWNLANDLESFRFQTGERFEKALFGSRWVSQLLVGQVAAMHPVVVILLPGMLLWLWRRTRAGDKRTLWLLAFGVPMAVFWVIASFWIQVKINWFVPTYFALLLGGVLWWSESGVVERRPRFARIAEKSVLLGLAVPLLAPSIGWMPQAFGTSWNGWDEVAEHAEAWATRVDAEDDIRGNVFFFATTYKDAAQLMRNLDLNATKRGAKDVGLHTTMAENVLGLRALQFDHWEVPERHIGEDAVFVTTRRDPLPVQRDRLRSVFEGADRVETLAIYSAGIKVCEAEIWLCRVYRGPIRCQGLNRVR